MGDTDKKLDEINKNLKIISEQVGELGRILVAIHQELESANYRENARNFMNRGNRRR